MVQTGNFMTDFQPKGKLTDSAHIRNRLQDIETYRKDGHTLTDIYRGLIASGVISCGWDNFKRVYYGVRDTSLANETEERSQSTETTANDSGDNSDLGNERKRATPAGFDPEATIAQAREIFRQAKQKT